MTNKQRRRNYRSKEYRAYLQRLFAKYLNPLFGEYVFNSVNRAGTMRQLFGVSIVREEADAVMAAYLAERKPYLRGHRYSHLVQPIEVKSDFRSIEENEAIHRHAASRSHHRSVQG